ncbi:MAG: rhomboid family intramembrane serine protease [Sphaerochaetaceae bacterium]
MSLNILNRKFRYTYTNVTYKIIGLNIAVFLLSYIFPRIQLRLALVPSYIIVYKWYWQFVTYMFVHGGFSHLFFNMLGLFFFGRPVEQRIGSREFLLFYLMTGFLSGLFSFISYVIGGTNVILVGASGAIYAVLLAFATFYPFARIFVFGLIPVRAPLLVVIYTFIELSNQIGGRGGNVAHLTHLAGLGFAYLYFLIRLKINPIDYWRR